MPSPCAPFSVPSLPPLDRSKPLYPNSMAHGDRTRIPSAYTDHAGNTPSRLRQPVTSRRLSLAPFISAAGPFCCAQLRSRRLHPTRHRSLCLAHRWSPGSVHSSLIVFRAPVFAHRFWAHTVLLALGLFLSSAKARARSGSRGLRANMTCRPAHWTAQKNV